jgi:hypothetical protein
MSVEAVFAQGAAALTASPEVTPGSVQNLGTALVWESTDGTTYMADLTPDLVDDAGVEARRRLHSAEQRDLDGLLRLAAGQRADTSRGHSWGPAAAAAVPPGWPSGVPNNSIGAGISTHERRLHAIDNQGESRARALPGEPQAGRVRVQYPCMCANPNGARPLLTGHSTLHAYGV